MSYEQMWRLKRCGPQGKYSEKPIRSVHSFSNDSWVVLVVIVAQAHVMSWATVTAV